MLSDVDGDTTPAGHHPRYETVVAEMETEVAKLRKQLAIERMEKDVLNKAAAYFARKSLSGTRSSSRCEAIIHLARCAVSLTSCAAASMLHRSAQDDERLKVAIKAARVHD